MFTLNWGHLVVDGMLIVVLGLFVARHRRAARAPGPRVAEGKRSVLVLGIVAVVGQLLIRFAMPFLRHGTGTIVGMKGSAGIVYGLAAGALAGGALVLLRPGMDRIWGLVAVVAGFMMGTPVLVGVNALGDRDPAEWRELVVESVATPPRSVQFGELRLVELGALTIPVERVPSLKAGDRVRARVRTGLLGQVRVDSISSTGPA